MTKADLEKVFEYHRCFGIFIWKHPPKFHARLRGQLAGILDPRGYRIIRLNGKNYYAHRLVWLFETGKFPELIDHINGDRWDNRIENLRDCSDRVNNSNTYRHRAGKLVGSSWMKDYQRWQSYINIGGRQKLLGYFDSEQAAHEAYLAALRLTSDFRGAQDVNMRQ